jgi:glycosyltransferase involved in cell wall biosynthesis
MREPLVSILIPAYNSQEWIGQALQSALAQTWPRKEVIVVDDGSTDQTQAVLREFAARNVLVARQPNRGAAAARNHAFSLCQGDYVQWLDADDILEADKVERQLRARDSETTELTLLSGPGRASSIARARRSSSRRRCGPI